jgi:hypothetical protein
MSTQTQHPFEDGSLEDKKHQLGEAPVNELSKEADAPSDRDDALSFEQQQGVTRIEALCRSKSDEVCSVCSKCSNAIF